MTSNVNLDYSSETTNFVWQQAHQKSSQCLIFNNKKNTKKLIPTQSAFSSAPWFLKIKDGFKP